MDFLKYGANVKQYYRQFKSKLPKLYVLKKKIFSGTFPRVVSMDNQEHHTYHIFRYSFFPSPKTK